MSPGHPLSKKLLGLQARLNSGYSPQCDAARSGQEVGHFSKKIEPRRESSLYLPGYIEYCIVGEIGGNLRVQLDGMGHLSITGFPPAFC